MVEMAALGYSTELSALVVIGLTVKLIRDMVKPWLATLASNKNARRWRQGASAIEADKEWR